MRPMSSIALLALIFLAPQKVASDSVQTKHFEIICHWQSERATEEARQVTEQVSKVAEQI